MKKFTFTLRSVLKLRTQDESAAAQHHAEALHRVQNLQEDISELEDSLKDQSQQLRNRMDQGSQSVILRMSQKGIDYYETQITQKSVELHDAMAELEQKKRELFEARREKKIIEKYQEELQEQHRYQTDHHEQKGIDEIASRGGISTSD